MVNPRLFAVMLRVAGLMLALSVAGFATAQAGVLTTLNFGSDSIDSGVGLFPPPGVYCPGFDDLDCFKDKTQIFTGHGTVEHVTLTARISNSFSLGEPSLYLAHAGVQVHLFNEFSHSVPGFGAGAVTITFDDLAAAPLPPFNLVDGTYRPDSPLSVFKGLDASGTWILTIGDHNLGDPSNFSAVVLAVTTPEPATLVLLVLGFGLLLIGIRNASRSSRIARIAR